MVLILTILVSIALTFPTNNKSFKIYLFLSIIVSIIIYQFHSFTMFLYVFIPSLIHVYIFTLLFILYGALKSKSKLGIFSAFLLFTIPFIIVLIPEKTINYQISTKVINEISAINFDYLIKKISQIIYSNNHFEKISLDSVSAIKIQIFIAFAYTYHYLNWFSKTITIGWYKSITKTKLGIISLLWFSSVSLYFYDYELGFIVLFTLSFLHVVLEFPLNFISIKGVFSSFIQKKHS